MYSPWDRQHCQNKSFDILLTFSHGNRSPYGDRLLTQQAKLCSAVAISLMCEARLIQMFLSDHEWTQMQADSFPFSGQNLWHVIQGCTYCTSFRVFSHALSVTWDTTHFQLLKGSKICENVLRRLSHASTKWCLGTGVNTPLPSQLCRSCNVE
jgi:hypothetical protein